MLLAGGWWIHVLGIPACLPNTDYGGKFRVGTPGIRYNFPVIFRWSTLTVYIKPMNAVFSCQLPPDTPPLRGKGGSRFAQTIWNGQLLLFPYSTATTRQLN